MSRLTRSKCPDLDEWVSVRFLDDGKWFACTLQRVLNCVQEPDIYNVVWTDGRKYKAQILKRGTKQHVHATEDDISVESKNQMSPYQTLSILKPKTEEAEAIQHVNATEDDTSVKSKNQMSPSLPETEEAGGEKGTTPDQDRDDCNSEEIFADSNDEDYIPDTAEDSSCHSNVDSECTFTPVKFPKLDSENLKDEDVKNVSQQGSSAQGCKFYKNSKKPKQDTGGSVKVNKTKWTTEEEAAVSRQLGSFLMDLQVPGKLACENCKKGEPALERRSWSHIKFFVYNRVKS